MFPPPPPPNNPPTILSLNFQQVPGQKFRIYGQVADETPASCGVVISGAANGVALCNATGHFDAIFNVPATGAIQAVAGDGQKQSQPAVSYLMNADPTVTVQATQGPNNAWTFSGTVSDEAPSGLIVTLTGPAGVDGVIVNVQANGAWTVTVTLPENTSGNVTATVTDWYSKSASGYTSF